MPTNHKKNIYIYVLACGLVSHARFAFFIEHITLQKFSWFSWFDNKVMDSKAMWHLWMAVWSH